MGEGKRAASAAAGTAAFLGSIVSVAPCPATTVSYTDLYTLQAPAGLTNPNPGHYHPAVGGLIAGAALDSSGDSNAVLWSSGGRVNLHPAGYYGSRLEASDGTSEVGTAFTRATAGRLQAGLWTSGSFVDLHDPSFFVTEAYGVGGGQQIGYGQTNPDPVTGRQYTRALLWTGTAGSVVNLQPAGYDASVGFGTDGTRQVGYASFVDTAPATHAMLWSGSADSYVDLHPASGFSYSYALNISGDQQVGYGLHGTTASSPEHALVWSSTAASVVDLEPAGFSSSRAYGTDGIDQVGYGFSTIYAQTHALFWSGSAASFIDLGAALPSTYRSSFAYSVSGNTVYGYATDANFKQHAIVWTVLPEPTGLGAASVAAMGLLDRRRRRRR